MLPSHFYANFYTFGHGDANRWAIISYNYLDEHKVCIQIIFDPVQTGENHKRDHKIKKINCFEKQKN